MWPEGADRRVALKLVDPITGAEGFLSLFHFPRGLPSFSVPPPGEMLADNRASADIVFVAGSSPLLLYTDPGKGFHFAAPGS